MLSIKLSENAGRAPEAVPFMPAGQHSICATVNGQPGRRVVTVDRAACERLQADLAEHLRASAAGEKARPMLMFDHTAGNAAARPLGFEWDDKRGILLRVEYLERTATLLRHSVQLTSMSAANENPAAGLMSVPPFSTADINECCPFITDTLPNSFIGTASKKSRNDGLRRANHQELW